MQCETMRIKPKNAEQGEYVLINASDFDSATMEEYSAPVEDTPVKMGEGKKAK